MSNTPEYLQAKIRILEQEMIYQHQAYAKVLNIVHAYQDVIRSADNLVDLVLREMVLDESSMGEPFMDAINHLKQALKHAYDPNGAAE